MRVFAMLVMSILLLACAAPAPSAGAQAPTVAAPTPQRKPGTPIKMPPLSGPLPSERVGDRPPLQADRSCKTDSDCAVKNVGNCCGHYPACVNKNSPIDPQGVQAACAKNGMASACGFREITACHCERNQCVDEQAPVGGWSDDPPPPPPTDR